MRTALRSVLVVVCAAALVGAGSAPISAQVPDLPVGPPSVPIPAPPSVPEPPSPPDQVDPVLQTVRPTVMQACLLSSVAAGLIPNEVVTPVGTTPSAPVKPSTYLDPLRRTLLRYCVALIS
jgi:hypothetical protein